VTSDTNTSVISTFALLIRCRSRSRGPSKHDSLYDNTSMLHEQSVESGIHPCETVDYRGDYCADGSGEYQYYQNDEAVLLQKGDYGIVFANEQTGYNMEAVQRRDRQYVEHSKNYV